jgi:hypothetical protein
VTPLETTAHQHQAEIIPHIQTLLAAAEDLDRLSAPALRSTLEPEPRRPDRSDWAVEG